MSWPVILTDNSMFMLKITRLLEWDFNKSQNMVFLDNSALVNMNKVISLLLSNIVANGRKIYNVKCSNLTFNYYSTIIGYDWHPAGRHEVWILSQAFVRRSVSLRSYGPGESLRCDPAQRSSQGEGRVWSLQGRCGGITRTVVRCPWKRECVA